MRKNSKAFWAEVGRAIPGLEFVAGEVDELAIGALDELHPAIQTSARRKGTRPLGTSQLYC
jgi:hypothetical protein